MRHLIVIAVLMFVGSIFVSSFANATGPQVRSEVTGWGTSYQYANADADRQLREIDLANPGYWCKVTGSSQDVEPLHNPPCWVKKGYILKEIKD